MNLKDPTVKLIAKVLSSGLLAVILLAGGGCADKVEVSDEVEREHPDMKKARVLEEAGDVRAARNVYESILDRDPTVARAHLELAFLLNKAGEDHVATIYHFRRYLALRPDTEKRAMIDNHIRSEMLGLVGTVFTNQATLLARMGEVEGENKALKIKISNLQSQTVQLRAALAAVRVKYGVPGEKASSPVDTVSLPVPVSKSLAKMVKVEKADTLKKMAARFYGDQDRWRVIYEANKKKMKSPGDLHVGQMIFIPEKE